MIRKPLTANQIIHGARAYSHNASRRAHQLSGPRRERAMHEPVTPSPIPASYFRTIMRTSDMVCECGFLVCSKRGPCAPVVAAPKPSPAPVVERQAHRFVIGQRVRGRGCSSGEWREGVVVERHADSHNDGLTLLRRDNGSALFVVTTTREPSEPLTSERGAQESDGWTPPAPWVAFNDTSVSGYECRDMTVERTCKALLERGHGPWYSTRTSECSTLAQALCKELNIELRDCAGTCRAFNGSSQLGDTWVGGDRVESCARAAVEAWSAMQREGTSDGK